MPETLPSRADPSSARVANDPSETWAILPGAEAKKRATKQSWRNLVEIKSEQTATDSHVRLRCPIGWDSAGSRDGTECVRNHNGPEDFAGHTSMGLAKRCREEISGDSD